MMQLGRNAEAFLLLVGTIVGVGMFGIPFVFERAGFLTGLVLLVVLAAAATLVHLAYAEVVSRTATVHRLPGYARSYLGSPAGWLASASYLFGLSGALLAYVVLGGSFVGSLVSWVWSNAPVWIGPLGFYLFGVAVIARGIRFEGLADAVLTIGLIVAIAILGLTLLPSASLAGIAAFHPGRLLIPYGVLLFSLAGGAIIPDLKRVLGPGGLSSLGKIVVAGTHAMVGATGGATTPDAVSGLAEKFGLPYFLLGNVIGVLATITSFIALGVVLEGMFASDFNMRPFPAWLLTAVIPAVLFGLGFQDFINIVSIVGAFAIGIDSMLVLAMHRRVSALSTGAPGAFRVAIPGALRLLLMALFAAGIVAELALGIP